MKKKKSEVHEEHVCRFCGQVRVHHPDAKCSECRIAERYEQDEREAKGERRTP